MEERVGLRIVFLYSRVPPYLVSLFRALMATGRVSRIVLVRWRSNALDGNLFDLRPQDWLDVYERDDLDEMDIVSVLSNVRPDAIYLPGWMDAGYMKAVRAYRRRNPTTVLAGIDDQWHGSLRQVLGSVFFKVFYRGLYDAFWVAGNRQILFASKFGYSGERIVPFLLSGDFDAFSDIRNCDVKRFVFLGRFDPVKGIDTIIAAHRRLPEGLRKEWPLVLIGASKDVDYAIAAPNEPVSILPFAQPEEVRRVLNGGGVACFASRHEQWGVAIHELAAAGFPLILSHACGAASDLLLEGFNGFSFPADNASILSDRMRLVASMTKEQRRLLSSASRKMASRITPELSANALLSFLNAYR